ncbi:hypothetical protein ACQ4LE_000940 [Meloidogyne hapla]
MFSDVTKFESIKCEIEWKLYEFDKHAEFMQLGQFLTSKQFYNPKCPSVRWELRVYLNTNLLGSFNEIVSDHAGNFVSLVQVGLKDSNESLKIKFGINIVTDDENKLTCYYDGIFNFKNRRESDKFQFCKPTTSDNSLTILCDVEFVPYNIKLENEFEDFLTTRNSFIDIFKKEILTDCVFEIGDEKINAHKCILAKYSIVFKTMFEQMGMSEAQNGKIKIVDSSPECFKTMLEYFYNGEIDKDTLEKYSEDLFAIAHKYEVKGLMQVCETSMASNIDASNFSQRCHYAELYCLPKLEKACVNFLSANKECFLISIEWNEFKVNNKELAFRLLEENILIEKDLAKKEKGPKQRIRTVLNENQLKALKDEFRNGHYPDIYSRKELANKTGLKEDIIQVWFTNKRARYRRKKRMNANN